MVSPAQNPIQRMIGIVDRIFATEPASKPSPQYSITALIERDRIHDEIAEDKAKLETFRAQETEFRMLLGEAYRFVVYAAERAKYKVETRAWEKGDPLTSERERFLVALSVHNDCLAEIATLERKIAEAQQDLDDHELWAGVL